MTAANLLTKLRDAGLRVAADGDALNVGPRELLTDELRAAIRAHKRDLLAELPRYRWLVIEPGGDAREIVCLPEQSARELAPCYPGARLLPLPDATAEAAEFLDRHAKETVDAA
jgi:hypothetical protein